jgi:hypothetical protein
VYALWRSGHLVTTRLEYYMGERSYAVGSRRPDYVLELRKRTRHPDRSGRQIAQVE